MKKSGTYINQMAIDTILVTLEMNQSIFLNQIFLQLVARTSVSIHANE